jgi:hypothetical protein
MNPYTSGMKKIEIWVPCMIEPVEGSREWHRAKQWELGRADRLAGEPCKSANGAYLEGWYASNCTK